ncbi:Warthog protein 6 [Dissostichus eleginoides]|uniref:Warthog protein 6 n=1 Tax=Dissostichus eleginoides TaxID=100907 RepID=A0AAD9FFC4_DISEL|nr:Warthog protein 6 [Dissostichus eleginoides]
MAAYTAYSGYSKPPQSYAGSYYDEKQAKTYADYQDSVEEEKKRVEKKDRKDAIYERIVYNNGNIYQPGYAYQPAYSYQPAYTYQPGYQPAYSVPPPGSVAYTPSQY